MDLKGIYCCHCYDVGDARKPLRRGENGKPIHTFCARMSGTKTEEAVEFYEANKDGMEEIILDRSGLNRSGIDK